MRPPNIISGQGKAARGIWSQDTKHGIISTRNVRFLSLFAITLNVNGFFFRFTLVILPSLAIFTIRGLDAHDLTLIVIIYNGPKHWR